MSTTIKYKIYCVYVQERLNKASIKEIKLFPFQLFSFQKTSNWKLAKFLMAPMKTI